MTKQCKIVLKELIKLSNSSEKPMYFALNAPHISLSKNSKEFYDYSPYSKEIEGIIQQLVNDNYLELLNKGHDFKLTHKGLHRKTFEWISFKSFLFKSIIVPIAVAAITSLITLWLQGQL